MLNDKNKQKKTNLQPFITKGEKSHFRRLLFCFISTLRQSLFNFIS